uniref:Uncharacterized protein n=1 Tax=Rousettus aegyptiacus TaxID=9407 RepID=A0A7J8C2M8_ROUAE|nr:hypothetical protein HJG63_009391 [Rousettus aegyptiacus]
MGQRDPQRSSPTAPAAPLTTGKTIPQRAAMTVAMTTPCLYFQICSSAQNSLGNLMQVTASLWPSVSSLGKLNIEIPGIPSSSQTEGCFRSYDLFCFHLLPEEMGRSDWPRAARRRWRGSAPDPRLELLTSNAKSNVS